MDESRIITPPTYLSVEEWESVGRNFIFLAGPIQGAADWQSDVLPRLEASGSADHALCIRAGVRGRCYGSG